MSVKPIRLMIVDDSMFFREFMSRSLSSDFSINVVGVASNPQEALLRIASAKPNILTLDIDIPNLQYLDYIRNLRQSHPEIQIVVISPLSGKLFEALKAGAVDFVAKPNPQMKMDNAGFIREVLGKIKTVYSGAFSSPAVKLSPPAATPATVPPASTPAIKPAIKVVTSSPPHPAAKAASLSRPTAQPLSQQNWFIPTAQQRVIAIGASTGGTEAILAVIQNLPVNTPGIVIVQHMPPVFTKMYAERLDRSCNMTVHEAKHGERLRPGLILLAEGDKQMRLAKDAQGYFVKCEGTEKVSGHCPSVDVLFESVAETAGNKAVGVILTGMGGDGGKNLLKMKEAGAYTIGQDEATCVVYGMPMVAYNLGAVADQLPLGMIGEAILNHVSKPLAH